MWGRVELYLGLYNKVLLRCQQLSPFNGIPCVKLRENWDEGKVRWNHVHGDSHPAIEPQNLYLTNNSGRIKLPKFKGVQPKSQTWRVQ